MLPRIIVFLVCLFVVYGGVRWWRSRRLIGDGGLNIIELNELMKLAKRSLRLDAALKLRVLIVDSASALERRRFSDRVDTAIRRLAKNEELGRKITAAIESIDQKALTAKVDEARVDAEIATEPNDRERKRNELKALTTQSEQIERLGVRKQELHESAEHIMVELRNLHLALLDARSSKESLDSEAVKNALSELEDASETLRQETTAEEEVNRMLRAASARIRQ